MKAGQLTKDFTIGELMRSTTADAEGFREQYYPSDAVCDNLTDLCMHTLQPLKDALPGLSVKSAYRCFRLNEHVGSPADSWHVLGKEVDLQHLKDGIIDNTLIIEEVERLQLPFDVILIDEDVIHLTYDSATNRRIYV